MANLIENGSFSSGDIAGWFAQQDTSVVYESGRIQLTVPGTPDAGLFGSAQFRPSGNLIALGALTVWDIVGTADPVASNDARFRITYFSGPDGTDDQFWDLHNTPLIDLSGPGQIEFGERDLAIPEGATHAWINLQYRKDTTDAPLLVTDFYAGAVDGDNPPYASADVSLTNRIVGGDFESGIGGWVTWIGDETIEEESVDPITGSKSLLITTPGGMEDQGAWVSNTEDATPVVAGENLRFAFSIKRVSGSGEIKADLGWNGGGSETQWSEVVTNDVQHVSVDLVAPVDTWGAYVAFLTVTDQIGAFVVDNVRLGSPDVIDENPPGGIMTALMVGRR